MRAHHVALALLGLWACNPPVPDVPGADLALTGRRKGEFRLHFEWDVERPPRDGTHYVYGHIDSWPPGGERKRLQTVGPYAYVGPVELQFEDTPSGEDRVVVVELRQGNTTDAFVAYYGISQRFNVSSNSTNDVDVAVRIRAVVTGSLRVVGRGEPGFTASPLVDVLVDGPSGTTAYLSSAVTFPRENTRTLEVTGPGTALRGWDLEAAQSAPCTAASEGCLRKVFLKLVDAFGYPSTTTSVDVTLDLKAPSLSALGPAFVDSSITDQRLTLNLSEPLQSRMPAGGVSHLVLPYLVLAPTDGTAPIPLLFDDEDGTCRADGGPCLDVGSPLEMVLHFRRPAVDRRYELQAAILDRAGNVSDNVGVPCGAGTCIHAFTVDTRAPEVTGFSAAGDAWFRDTETIHATLQLGERVERAEVALVRDRTSPFGADEPLEQCGTSCHFSLPLGDVEDGFWALQARVTDLAGNTTVRQLTEFIIVDSVGPQVIIPATVGLQIEGPTGSLAHGAERDARQGSTLQVSFAMNEEVTGTPPVEATLVAPDGTTVVMTSMTGGGTVYVFSHRFPDTDVLPEGTWALRVRATDLAGNETVEDVPGFALAVDTTPPSAPIVSGLRHERTTWGSDATRGLPAFRLVGDSTIVGDRGALLVVIAGASLVGAAELGRATLDDQGRCGIVNLAPRDEPVISVVLVDAAGNASTPARVTKGTLVWTPGHKVRGDTASNPSILRSASRFPAALTLFNDDVRELDAPLGVARTDTTTVTVVAQPSWLHRHPQLPAEPRTTHAIAFDPARDRLVVFGGTTTSNTQYATSVMEFNPRTLEWSRVEASGEWPAARAGGAMVADPYRGYVMLFGGWQSREMEDASQDAQPTWTWSGTQWTRVNGADPNPGTRFRPALAYDPERREVVLFGGTWAARTAVTIEVRNDVWRFDGDTGAWLEVVSPSAVLPPPRTGAVWAYNPATRLFYLTGGVDYISTSPLPSTLGGGGLNDLWTWNPDTAEWTRLLEDRLYAPLVNRGSQMSALDVSRQVIVSLGGYDGTNRYSDVHELSLANPAWRAATSHPELTPRSGLFTAAYDPHRETLWFFGGLQGASSPSTTLKETWERRGGTGPQSGRLLPRTPSLPSDPNPCEGDSPAGTWSASMERAVYSGGLNLCVPTEPDRGWATWEPWRGQWELRAEDVPDGRYGHLSADETGDRMLLVGGAAIADTAAYTRTWRYDVAAPGWTSSTSTTGPFDSGAATTFVPPLGTWVGLGPVMPGVPGAGTVTVSWEEGLTRWAPVALNSSGPPVHAQTRLVWDPASGRLVMLNTDDDTTWLLDPLAMTWTPCPAMGDGPVKPERAVAYDPARRRVVSVGARTEFFIVQDTNVYELAIDVSAAPPLCRWTRRVPRNAVPYNLDMSFNPLLADTARGLLLLKEKRGVSAQGMWELDMGATARPALLWELPLSSAGLATGEVNGLKFRWSAKGAGTSDGSPVSGTTLWAWDAANARWETLGTSGVAVVTGTAAVDRLLLKQGRTLHVAITPSADTGTGEPGNLQVDSVSVAVDYVR